jgi:Mn-containing catalase
MTREIAHQQSFEKALYSIQPNFPVGKLPGMPEFTNVYFNMSTGEGDLRGPWNKEPTFEYREAETAVDGGDGLPTVGIDGDDLELVNQAAMRLQSDPKSDPVTGAMLGMDNGTSGPSGNGRSAAALSPKAAKMEAKTRKAPTARRS